MCALPASHLKVHDTIEQGRAGEQKHLPMFFLALGDAYFALGSILYLRLHGLTDEHSMAC
jgi:hypothetical protein